MFITNAEKVRGYVVRKKGAKGVRVKYLLHKGVGAKHLQLRLFTIDVRGYTPLERHEHEHEVYVLRGKVSVHGGESEVIARTGNVMFISSNEEHQFKNIDKESVEFLCTKQTEM